MQASAARVLVLSGLPRAFSAGVSVAEHVRNVRDRAMLTAMRNALTALVKTPAVTVAAVSGACRGGGAEIVWACDLAVVTEDARVGFPEIRLACFPPGATALLPARIGGARAAEWILTGETGSGREAAEAGFASRALTVSELGRRPSASARNILSRVPGAGRRPGPPARGSGASAPKPCRRRRTRTVSSPGARTSRAPSNEFEKARRRGDGAKPPREIGED